MIKKPILIIILITFYFYNCYEIINFNNTLQEEKTHFYVLDIKLENNSIYSGEICNLGSILKDQSKDVKFEIKNIGSISITLEEIKITGDNNSFFIIKNPERNIDVDATTDFIVRVSSSSLGEKMAILEISDIEKKLKYNINIKINIIEPFPEFVLKDFEPSSNIILKEELPKSILFKGMVETRYNAIVNLVTIDLSQINGNPFQEMFDNGLYGDENSNDSIYSFLYNIPLDVSIDNFFLPVTVIGNAEPVTTFLNLKITDLLFLNSHMEENIYNIDIVNFEITYPTIEAKVGNRCIRIEGRVGASNSDIFKVLSLCNNKRVFNKISFWLKGYSEKGLVVRIGSSSTYYFNINDDTKYDIIALNNTPIYTGKTLNVSEWQKIELNVSSFNPEELQFILRGGSNAYYDIYLDHIIYE